MWGGGGGSLPPRPFLNFFLVLSRSEFRVPRKKTNFQLKYGFRFLRSGLVSDLQGPKVRTYFGFRFFTITLTIWSEMMLGAQTLKIEDRTLHCFSHKVMVLDFRVSRSFSRFFFAKWGIFRTLGAKIGSWIAGKAIWSWKTKCISGISTKFEKNKKKFEIFWDRNLYIFGRGGHFSDFPYTLPTVFRCQWVAS